MNNVCRKEETKKKQNLYESPKLLSAFVLYVQMRLRILIKWKEEKRFTGLLLQNKNASAVACQTFG